METTKTNIDAILEGELVVDNKEKNEEQVDNLIMSSSSLAFLPDDDQEKSKIVNFYENRSVLITGASGFIGKVLVEKLLRTCKGIRNIFVIIRPKRQLSPEKRYKEFLELPLFDAIRKEQLERKIVVMQGDALERNLGLSDKDLLRLINEVSVIYHSAATVKFDEPLSQAIGINIEGVQNVVSLARKLPQLAAFVHVSTAYANCDRNQIDEHVYPVDIEPEQLLNIRKWLDSDAMQSLKSHLLREKPNTYTYTKAMAEYLLVKTARDLPIVICRPSIVVASWRDPFPGWIDNVNGPTGIILGAAKGLIRSMYAQSDYRADLVPVDTVINMIITLGWFANAYRSHKDVNISTTTNNAEEVYPTIDSYSLESSGEFFERDTIASSTSSSLDLDVDSTTQTTMDHSNVDNIEQLPRTTRPTLIKNNQVKPQDQSSQLPSLMIDEGYSSARSPTDSNSLSYSNLSSSSSSLNVPSSLLSISNERQESKNRGKLADNLDSIDVNSAGNVDLVDCEDRVSMINYVAKQRLFELNNANLETKLKQFRLETQAKVAAKNLAQELADIPVFHCTSGTLNPITWGRIQYLVLAILTMFPSIQTLRSPGGSFTNKKMLDNFYKVTLHYIPGYIIDLMIRLRGGKPHLVNIYRKFDQASNVLQAFTMKEWHFDSKNSTKLQNEFMSDVDKRLFQFDLQQLDWYKFFQDYVLGVRKHLLKESIDNLCEARRNLYVTYYRNLGLQLISILMPLCYILYVLLITR